MQLSRNKNITAFAFVLLAVFFCVNISSAKELLTQDNCVLSSNVDGAFGRKPHEVLLDGKLDTWWVSANAMPDPSTHDENDYHINGDCMQRLEVELTQFTLQPNDDKDLVVYVQRVDTDNLSDEYKDQGFRSLAPTSFLVRAKAEGDEKWTEVSHVFLTFRGPGTKEYSGRIPMSLLPKDTKYLRFVVIANIAKARVIDENGKERETRRMSLAEFNILEIGKNDPYTGKLFDRYRLNNDYLMDYNDYEFIHSRGILDKFNQNYGNQGVNSWNVEHADNHIMPFPSDEQWENAGVHKPDFSMIKQDNGATDFKGERQSTHVTEHELYAIRGDAVALYPFYEFYEHQYGETRTSQSYHENFSHWYDYHTGKSWEEDKNNNNERVDYLDFLIDPAYVFRTEDNGYYGGKNLYFENKGWRNDLSYEEVVKRSPDLEISTVDEYINFANNPSKYNGKYIVLNSDLDFHGASVPSINNWNGEFDGKRHVISNAKLTNGMFNNVNGHSIIKNIVLDKECIISTTENSGGGVIGYISAPGKKVFVHGIVNHGNILASNINQDNKGIANGGIIGGVDAYNDTELHISDCAFSGKIEKTHDLIINTTDEYIAFAQDPSKYSEKTVVLGNDLDFNNTLVPTINNFEGEFNGNGHSIKNAQFSPGMFNNENGSNAAFIQNFTLEESCRISGNDKGAGVIAIVHTNQKDFYVHGIINKATIVVSNASNAITGGIVGGVIPTDWDNPNINISDCAFTGKFEYVPMEEYRINNVNDYIKFAQNSQEYSGKIIILNADLDFSGKEVPTINDFSGIFNGNNHTIKNASFVEGVFNISNNANATICNLIIAQDCHITQQNGWPCKGGFIGSIGKDSNVKIHGIINKGVLTNSLNWNGDIGGIVGSAEDAKKITISDCAFTGTINAQTNCGLLIGNGKNSNIYITNSYSSGIINKTTNINVEPYLYKGSNIVGTNNYTTLQGSIGELQNVGLISESDLNDPSTFVKNLGGSWTVKNNELLAGQYVINESFNNAGLLIGNAKKLSILNSYTTGKYGNSSNDIDERFVYKSTDRNPTIKNVYVSDDINQPGVSKMEDGEDSSEDFIGKIKGEDSSWEWDTTKGCITPGNKYTTVAIKKFKRSGLIIGWGDKNLTITGSYSTGEYYPTDEFFDERFLYNAEGTYSVESSYMTSTPSINQNGVDVVKASEINAESLGGNWEVIGGELLPKDKEIEMPKNPEEGGQTSGYPNRKYGSIATFFYPRVMTDKNELQPLPREYVIAADFSQTFSMEHNVDKESKKIKEPIIQFRHIFRIKDGKEFAEKFSGSKRANDSYISENVRRITAPKNVDFEVRFNSPVPVQTSTRSKWYYKISNSDYRRVCSMEIWVWKGDASGEPIQKSGLNNENGKWSLISGEKEIFRPDADFEGTGYRMVDGIRYNVCGGGGSYYRMLHADADNIEEGKYTVRLMGRDYNGELINIFGEASGTAPLIVQELQITFLSDSKAAMLNTNDSGKEMSEAEAVEAGKIPEHMSDAYLEKWCGQPVDFIHYDEYARLEGEEFGGKNNETNNFIYFNGNDGDKNIYRWPVAWGESNYAFGYNRREDYNMYAIASHSSVTSWHPTAPDLYDRHYYKTGGKEHGYFYYVNGAADPGVMARLNLDGFCVGSTIFVTGWIVEMSSNNVHMANVSLNFIGITEDGTKIPLHTHVLGAYPHNGVGWRKFYASFTPEISTDYNINSIVRYEIELNNNTRGSMGADYALDDIKVYIANPKIESTQMDVYCGEHKTKQRFDVEFDALLRSIGFEEPAADGKGQDKKIYYSIFDKGKFEKLLTEHDGFDEEVFNGSVLEYNYNGTTKNKWGVISFNTDFESNPKGEDVSTNMPNIVFQKNIDGVKYLSFYVEPTSEDMAAGKTYLAAIYVPEAGNTDSPSFADFDLTKPCASKQAEFTVKGSNVIRVDGVVQGNTQDIYRCENQFPVVQVDIYGINQESNDLEHLYPCALLDWFRGSMADFEAAGFESIDLSEAIYNFRMVYPTATGIDQEIGKTVEGGFTYKEEYKKCLAHFINEKKLIVGSKSYMFDSKILDGKEEVDVPVVAIPANRATIVEVGEQEYLVCSNPTELTLHVDKRAPGLLDGFNLPANFYPEGMKDVPVRAGRKHLMAASGKDQALTVPLRGIKIVTTGATELTVPENDAVYLVQTDDELFADLTEDVKAENGAGLIQVGTITAISGATGEGSAVPSATIHFDRKFNFREGYFYTVRFNYTEKNPDNGPTSPDAPAGADEVCDGQTIFTIKVVPEYQMWTGESGNLNWNNDANWRRVTSAELLTADGGASKSDFVTDGTIDGKIANGRTFSFAPLDFTKVIVPAGTTYPRLYGIPSDLPEEIKTNYPIMDYSGTAGDSSDPIWSSKPNPSEGGAETEEVTAYVQYDLAAYHPESADEAPADVNPVKCRTWYANACEQIHFLTNSEIMGQQHLLYAKAWVDMKMEPDRWYLAASPLQDVIAGDMYLPTDGARQLTELFQPITFSKDINDRFRPAVYQRGWDKGSAVVYELPGSGHEQRNVAVSLDWSHVYNDVKEPYSGGMGYSVKTDVSQANNFDETAGNVLFRLPKDDKAYDYWSQDGSQTGPENGGSIVRANHYRLNPVGTDAEPAVVTLSNAGGNRYFLAGNPFMAHLDMKEFLKKNESVIEPKYWIMTADSQGVAIMGNDGEFVSTIDEAGELAPMQGFFVEAKEGNMAERSLTLTFSHSMAMNKEWTEADGTILRSATRSAASPALLVTPYDADGSRGTAATVILSPDAAGGYRDFEDAVLLDDRSSEAAKVFTIADDKAVSINALDNADGLEIGVIAGEDAVNHLVFENVERFDHLLLLDKATGATSPLYEGMEVEVKGTASGRFFLVASSSAPEVELLGLRLSVDGQDVTVHAPNSDTAIEVSAYTVSGMEVARVECEGEATLTLDKGVYIITARASDGTTLRRKIMI